MRSSLKVRLMMSLKAAAAALAALAMATCGGPGDPPAKKTAAPAMWKVGDADTTVYLFGTVHVLPPDLKWRTAAIDKAMNEAKAVYFETDIDPDPRELLPFIQQLGMYGPSDRLSDHLKPEDRAMLAKVAGELGTPMPMLDTMRPWLAGVTLSEQMITKAGYDVNSGVERKLEPDAKAAGKEIRKLETVTDQLRVFADLPEEVQIRFLVEGLKEIETESAILDDMVNAWAVGDIAKLDKIMIQDDLAETPEIYEALLVNRNKNWVVKLDELIRTEPGTFFVAVGAAHLIGKDGVPTRLEPLGYKPERIE